MNILQALEDDELFARAFRKRRGLFKKGDSWAAWKVFLAGLFGLAMTAEQRFVYERHTGRTDVGEVTEAYVICGRRSGKSFIAAAVGVFAECFRSTRNFYQRGKRGRLRSWRRIGGKR